MERILAVFYSCKMADKAKRFKIRLVDIIKFQKLHSIAVRLLQIHKYNKPNSNQTKLFYRVILRIVGNYCL